MSKENKLRVEKSESKTFSYFKGNTSLNFTLRVDQKEEVKNFLELLSVAKRDIEEEIKIRFN